MEYLNHGSSDKTSDHMISDPRIESPREAGEPHEAMILVLPYLPVSERLAMAAASKSLRQAVSEDILVWFSVVFTEPSNVRVTDEILSNIASKANGRMTTLAIENCYRVTDLGLARVVETNPFLRELHLSGCSGLTPDGIIHAVKTLTSHQNLLRSLRINGVYSLRKQHLETLSQCLQISKRKPIFYHQRYKSSSLPSPDYQMEIEGFIDVETCPKCAEVRLVFDCPRQSCIEEHKTCRGCEFCIVRCNECGMCVNYSRELPEATACEDSVCSDCWLNLPKCCLCNLPYCTRHAALKGVSYLQPFVCESCVFESSL